MYGLRLPLEASHLAPYSVSGAAESIYNEKADTYKLLKELMALPFLPAEVIPRMFTALKERAGTHIENFRTFAHGSPARVV